MVLDEAQLRSVYVGSFGDDQLAASVVNVAWASRFGGGNRAEGEITFPYTSARVGQFARIAHHTKAGESAVYNDGLEIEPSFHRRGFATQFNSCANGRLKSLGVTVVRVTAGRNGGGRAWARYYDFDEERIDGFGAAEDGGIPLGVGAGGEHVVLSASGSGDQRRLALATALFEAAHADGRISDDELAELKTQAHLLDTPASIAALAEGVGDDVLRNSRWPGIRRL